jgi:hypothetical protein
MSGGIEEMYGEERMGLKEALEKGLKTIAPYSTHYRALNPEPINVIEGWGLGFNLGNAIKYIARAEYKGSKEADLEKAIWYLQRELLK